MKVYNGIIKNMIDLHIHSTYSDGTDTIEEIIKEAKLQNLSQIAITDHNTIFGSTKANIMEPNLAIVGIELSVGYKDEELHLLGYFPNGSPTIYKNINYIIKLGEINKNLAVTEMIERLNNQGYDISVNELAQFSSGTINRVHICRALMKHGYIKSVSEGFDTLIGDHCPAYVAREYVSIVEASQAIHDDGGIAVIAHPYNYKKIKDIPQLLGDIKDMIDGIECFHYTAKPQDSVYLINYAKENGKIITGGSDYHGKNKNNVFLNMMKVSDQYSIQTK